MDILPHLASHPSQSQGKEGVSISSYFYWLEEPVLLYIPSVNEGVLSERYLINKYWYQVIYKTGYNQTYLTELEEKICSELNPAWVINTLLQDT